jgi:hypothetical protein
MKSLDDDERDPRGQDFLLLIRVVMMSPLAVLLISAIWGHR